MSWIVLFLYLIPLIFTGIFLVRKISFVEKIELLIPTAATLGISLFIFLLNLVSFFIKGPHGIIFSYLLTLCLGFAVYKLKSKSSKIEYLFGRSLFFNLLSLIVWLLFIFWKGNHGLIGSDTNLYWGIAHTFIKGNFPPLTPWQPDLLLQYHLGPFELLGAFYLFTNLSFEFLHIFFSCLFIFLTSQIIMWIWKRHDNWPSFIWANISVLLILVSFGFFKIIIPIFPLKFPDITNFHELFLWIRNLPTVNQSIEVYGAPINLDALIYFIFHSFGLALFFTILVIFTHSFKKNVFIKLLIILFGLGSLALIEGGFITNHISPENSLEKSILLFPNKNDANGDFMSYHYYQEISKILPLNKDWLPFRWFHIGIDVLITVSLICLTFIKFSKEQKFLVLALFLSGFFSLLAYNFVVPKFLIANGNRFLAFSFIFLSLSIMLSIYNLIDFLQKKGVLGYLLVLIFTFFILLPTILPPLFLLSINRFGENKLIPKQEDKTPAIEWIEKNLPYNTKIMVLDARSPHPSGQARAMVQAGVFAPIFPEQFRAYTLEASPEYFDVAYYLDPKALKKLKINTLLIDNVFFETLPEKRRHQLTNNKYFEKIFEHYGGEKNWEKVYRMDKEYLKEGGEIDGTFEQLEMEIPKEKKVYIDNEENFEPSYLRRAIIFTLRDRDLYYLPQSGTYLNVEVNINQHEPLRGANYDYLVLSKNTDPKNICKCQPTLIWQGLKEDVFVWKN